MRAVPWGARAYGFCAALAALVCAAPVFSVATPSALGAWHPAGTAGSAAGPGAPGIPWAAVALLTVLHTGCQQLPCRPPGRGGAPRGPGPFVPVLLAGAFLLPPAAAALIPLPGALAGRTGERPGWLRRVGHAAHPALASYAAAGIFRVGGLDGPRAVAAADVPYALLPVAVASLAFCLVLTALDGGVLIAAEGSSPRTAWRGEPLRSLAPHLVHGLAGLMMAVLWNSAYGPAAALLVLLPMYLSCWNVAQYHCERAAHQATVRALVQAVEIKDRYTRGHGDRVGRVSVMIARELGMADDRLEALRCAGTLHDVGKLGVPTRLLRKAGPLTIEERQVMELHPEYGHDIVRGIGSLREARAAILHHHERVDGRGYPYGLRGTEIPEFARVVAVADAFDAMTSTRSYRRARPVLEAVDELRRCSGSQFDPRMVRALARALARHSWHPAVAADAPAPRCGNVPPPGPAARAATAPHLADAPPSPPPPLPPPLPPSPPPGRLPLTPGPVGPGASVGPSGAV